MNDKEKIDALWQILVMLKRDLDVHSTKENFLELPHDTWTEAVTRARNICPEKQ